MVLTRATNQPGPDGMLGTGDDVHEHTNTTSPFVDQNQTYSSHPSHQVFLRAYVLNADGEPVATGKLITGGAQGGMANWGQVKAQARELLGIDLTDADVGNVPLLATDPYGMFIRGPNGFVQVVMNGRHRSVEGDPSARRSASRTRCALDMPSWTTSRTTRYPSLAPAARWSRTAPTTSAIPSPAARAGSNLEYDNELLDRHFIAGDGRVNENIGLTAVHHVFHAEHNRLVESTKQTALESGDLELLNGYLLSPVGAIPTDRCRNRRIAVERRAPVPGRQVRHRDAVPAPGIRGVRAQDPAATSTRSSRRTASTPPSIRRSWPSSRTRCTASAIRC